MADELNIVLGLTRSEAHELNYIISAGFAALKARGQVTRVVASATSEWNSSYLTAMAGDSRQEELSIQLKDDGPTAA